MANQFFSWRTAFMEANISATTKHVLHVISTYMNDHGTGAFPSIETLVSKSSLSNRTIITHIYLATQAGWLDKGKLGKKGQGWMLNTYKIRFPEAVNLMQNGKKGSEPNAEGSEPNDKKAVKEVHTITPYITPSNTPDVLFEEFWKAYTSPHKKQRIQKGSRKPALASYKKAIKVDNHKTIMDGLSSYLKELAKNEYIGYCNAASWLNQERWERFKNEPDEVREIDHEANAEFLKQLEAQGKPSDA